MPLDEKINKNNHSQRVKQAVDKGCPEELPILN